MRTRRQRQQTLHGARAAAAELALAGKVEVDLVHTLEPVGGDDCTVGDRVRKLPDQGIVRRAATLGSVQQLSSHEGRFAQAEVGAKVGDHFLHLAEPGRIVRVRFALVEQDAADDARLLGELGP